MNLTDSPLLKTIVDSAPIGICILHIDGLLAEMVNDKFIEITGIGKEAIIGKNFLESFAQLGENIKRHSLTWSIPEKRILLMKLTF